MSRSYIARCPGCNNIVAAVIAKRPAAWEPELIRHLEDVEKTVDRWIKDGLLIEQVDSEVVKIQAWGCKCRRFNSC